MILTRIIALRDNILDTYSVYVIIGEPFEVGEWGDGWMPNRASVEEIKRGRERLEELAQRAGRDP